MSKRTQTDSAAKNPKNFWPTPFSATAVLARHLTPHTHYVEPCAGDGAIVAALGLFGHTCAFSCDIEPRAPWIAQQDATAISMTDHPIITNPPFDWKLLEPLLDHWIGAVEAWLLLPWDMTCNKRFSPYAAHIDRILPIGRVSWLDNGQGGMENNGWFHFNIERQDLILPRM